MSWRDLADERQKASARARAIFTKPNATDADMREGDQLLQQITDLSARIEQLRGDGPLPVQVGEPRGGAVTTMQTRFDQLDDRQSRALGVAASRQYGDAFGRYIRSQETPEDRQVMAPGFSRDQVVGTGASGGFIAPPQFLQQLVEAQLYYGGMRAVSTIINTSDVGGADLPIPTDNDSAQAGAILAEAGAITAQDIGAFGQVILKSYMYTSRLIRVSLQLMQDSFFPMEEYLGRKLAIRLGRIQNTHFTTGTGTGQPNGIVTAAAAGKVGLAGQTVSVIYDDLIDLIHSVDPAYRYGQPGLPRQSFVGAGVPVPRPYFMMHDSTLKALQKLKDTAGHPLWAPPGAYYPGMSGPAPETILGYPYVVNNDVPVMAANAKSILFGDFSNYFIRDALDVRLLRLDERYADTLEVGFIAFQRTDGNLINAGTAPVKYYQNSAT